MDIILDDEFVTSRDGGFRHFLVKWHGCPDYDATWIKEDDLHHLVSRPYPCLGEDRGCGTGLRIFYLIF